MKKQTIINNHIPDASEMVEDKEKTIKQLEEAYNKTYNKISLVKNYNENKYWSWAMFNTCLAGVVGARIIFEWILEPIVKMIIK